MAKVSTSRALPALQSYETGKRLRDVVPRDAMAAWKSNADRDPIELLRRSSDGRIGELLPLRWARMTEDPFAFLRGAASVMAADLAGAALPQIPVQACGDAHILNFGVFVSPEGSVRFDVNDFDETLPGVSFMVDLCRLAASVAVAATVHGASPDRARETAERSIRSYRHRMRDLAGLSPVEIWSRHVDIAEELPGVGDRSLRRQLTRLAKSRRAEIEEDDNLSRMTQEGGRRLRLREQPPTLFHLKPDSFAVRQPDLLALVRQCLARARPEVAHMLARYEPEDVAFKVVGVGSVGTFSAVALLEAEQGPPLLLQVKEAGRSVLEAFGGWTAGAAGTAGERVVDGQRLMQASTDPFLGFMKDAKTGRQFYIRRLKNHRLGSLAEDLAAADLDAYAALTARALALSHARTGNPAMIAGWLGRSGQADMAVAKFAQRYAGITARDHKALASALDNDGQIRSRTAATMGSARGRKARAR